MRTYKVVCHQSGNGWLVNASSGKRAVELVIENSGGIYAAEDIRDDTDGLKVWEVFMNSLIEEVVEH